MIHINGLCTMHHTWIETTKYIEQTRMNLVGLIHVYPSFIILLSIKSNHNQKKKNQKDMSTYSRYADPDYSPNHTENDEH